MDFLIERGGCGDGTTSVSYDFGSSFVMVEVVVEWGEIGVKR